MTPTTPVAVVDTNLLIKALMGGPGSSPVLRAWRDQRIHLAVCQELLEKLAEVLTRPRFQKYFTRRDVQEFLFLLRRHGVWVELTARTELCRDPKDNFLLNLAISAKAQYLVSADKDLIDAAALRATMEREHQVKIIDVSGLVSILAE